MEEYIFFIVWAFLLAGAFVALVLSNWFEVLYYRKKLGDKTITRKDIDEALRNEKQHIISAYMDVKHEVERIVEDKD